MTCFPFDNQYNALSVEYAGVEVGEDTLQEERGFSVWCFISYSSGSDTKASLSAGSLPASGKGASLILH